MRTTNRSYQARAAGCTGLRREPPPPATEITVNFGRRGREGGASVAVCAGCCKLLRLKTVPYSAPAMKLSRRTAAPSSAAMYGFVVVNCSCSVAVQAVVDDGRAGHGSTDLRAATAMAKRKVLQEARTWTLLGTGKSLASEY